MSKNKAVFCCFGEVLFDVLPEKKVIGGAALNVAVWLHRLGNQVKMISRVGQDENGKVLLHFMEHQGLTTQFIGTDAQLPTSTVSVHLDAGGSATYTIEKPVAWDAIPLSKDLEKTASATDVLIYNSLTLRSETSRETLFKLLETTAFKALDVNLRPPHYTAELLKALMQQADLIKFNEDEIIEIAGYLGISTTDLQEAALQIFEKTNTPSICVTLGGDGVLFYHRQEFYRFAGYPARVKDTVGAGDAFLAALLSGLQQSADIMQVLKQACALGAAVASEEGALPELDLKKVFGVCHS